MKNTKAKALDVYKPQASLHLNQDDLAEIKNWEVGKKYELRVTVELVNLSKGDEFAMYEGSEYKKKFRARFNILSVKSK